MKGVIGVVILYFPDRNLVDRLNSFVHVVDELLLIDNSESPTVWLASLHNDRTTIIVNNKNLGIARALNQACEYALQKNAAWLLSMDQDSEFDDGSAELLMKCGAEAEGTVAICCPTYHHQTPRPGHQIRFTMTSGSMLRLRAYQLCGPFDEKLFIDSVDHEYCLRLRKAGWKIMKTQARLHHAPGKKVVHRVSGFSLPVTEHPAWRHYFMARNRLVVMFRYMMFDPLFFFHELIEYPKQLTRIVVFENQKLIRLNYMFRGIYHFMVGRFPNHA